MQGQQDFHFYFKYDGVNEFISEKKFVESK